VEGELLLDGEQVVLVGRGHVDPDELVLVLDGLGDLFGLDLPERTVGVTARRDRAGAICTIRRTCSCLPSTGPVSVWKETSEPIRSSVMRRSMSA